MNKKKWTIQNLSKEAKKHKTRSAFKKASPSAYATAIRTKQLDKICSHMPRSKIKKRNHWTRKNILKEARKYKSRIAFQVNNCSAYNAAGKLKIRDQVCAHMRSNKWTKIKILNEVEKYRTYTEFQKHSASAYNAAKRLNILDDIKKLRPCSKMSSNYWTESKLTKVAKKYSDKTAFRIGNSPAFHAARKHPNWSKIVSHMPHRKKVKTLRWNEEQIRKIAKNIFDRTEFNKKYSGAANAARKLGIYDEIVSHMPFKVSPKGTWNKEEILAISKKYKSRSEFQSDARNVYLAARKLGILDKACEHMTRVGSRFKRALYAFEFPDKSVYVGLTFNYEHRYRSHMSRSKEIIRKTNKLGHEFIMFNEYYDKDVVAKKEAELIEKYLKKGWNILNRSKAGALGSNVRRWTKAEILKEAKKYNSIAEFNKNNGSAYNAALKLGLKEEIKMHMTNLRKPDGYWTKRTVLKEAKKYRTRSDFHKNSPTAFMYAKILGIRDECYLHMVKPSRIRKWSNGGSPEKL